LHAAGSESLHLLHELTESAEYEGPAQKPSSFESSSKSQQSTTAEPWLRNRLRQNIAFWRTFCTSTLILSILTVGYHLPLLNGPPPGPHFQKNHPSAFEFPEFVTEAVQQLVITGAAMEVPFRPFVVSPLGVVPKAMNKLRLILDLRFINSFLEVQKFKYESIREVSQLAKLGDYLFSADLKSGYHHVDVAPEFWQYLGFEWQGKYYVFCQLPFGLATACFVFTKLMKQLVAYWRKRGIRVIPYIDDFLFICSSAAEFSAVQSQVLQDFARAGFVLSHDKCQLRMSHALEEI
jgi:hypothetical protein